MNAAHARSDTIALILVAGYALLLLLVGWRVHVIETPNSAEMDGYAAMAERILAGEIPRDPYHPLLYPILSAGAGALAGGAFAGARIVSSLAAGLLLAMTYLVARRCFSREAGLFALAALMLNYNVFVMGMEAATDMTFAGLALTVLYLCLRLESDSSGFGTAAILGASFSLALFTRYSGFFLLPAVAAAFVILSRRAPERRAVTALAIFAAAALAVLAPHFIITERVFGTPWYNESWRNLAMKMHGGYDWSYFREARFENLRSALASSPGALIASFLREIAKFFSRTLSELGGQGPAGWLFAVAALAGFAASWFGIDRGKIILACFAVFYIALGCLFFYSGPRLMLPVLPLGYLWAGSLLFSPRLAGSLRMAALRIPRAFPIVAIFLVALLASGTRYIAAFVDAHPVEELEAARTLEREHGDDITVLGTFPFMQRYVRYRYAELSGASGAGAADPSAYIESLRREAAAAKADFVVIGKRFLGNRPVSLLDASHAPDFLEPVMLGSEVAVYRVRKELLR